MSLISRSHGTASRFRQIEQKTPCRHNLYLPCANLYLVLFISRHDCTGLQTVFRHRLGQSCELPFPGLWLGHRFADLNQHAPVCVRRTGRQTGRNDNRKLTTCADPILTTPGLGLRWWGVKPPHGPGNGGAPVKTHGTPPRGISYWICLFRRLGAE